MSGLSGAPCPKLGPFASVSPILSANVESVSEGED